MTYPFNQKKSQALFLVIETVPASLQSPDNWDKEKNWMKDAGYSPEFGRIACAALGRFKADKISTSIIDSNSEKDILLSLTDTLNLFYDKEGWVIYMMNSKWVVPFVNRRCLVNKVHLAYPFRTFMFKPWELSHISDFNELLAFNGTFPSIYDIVSSYGSHMASGDLIGEKYLTGDMDYVRKTAEVKINVLAALFNRFSECV